MCWDNVCQLEIFIKCLLFYWLRNVWVSGWLQAFRTSTVDSFCGVRACAGVYVPCAATPPFPIFIELCLSLKPWQQKMTNGRTVEMLRLCARLNGWASFLGLNIFFFIFYFFLCKLHQWTPWLAFSYSTILLFNTSGTINTFFILQSHILALLV